MEKLSDNYKHIPGWGSDADPANEPTYPMKNYTGEDHGRLDYERPPMQRSNAEILHSKERPGLSAVFGSVLPPNGLSGAIRRLAFRYSEGTFSHWLLLLLADRVNVYEGLLDDMRRGQLPNTLAERGYGAIWKYDKKLFARKMFFPTLALAVVLVLVLKQRRH